MRAEHLEILVEEPSMEAFLRALLPRLLGDAASFEVYSYQCKNDLLDKLPVRLRGYASWLPETWRIVVVVDRDDDDCQALKQRLDAMAVAAGLRTRSSSGSQPWQVVNRIAIEELEAWYFGDWQAVCSVYPKVSPTVPNRASYRDPDAIRGTWEAFERILKQQGYFKTGLRKVEAARAIGTYFDPACTRSRSFVQFLGAIEEATA